MPTLSPLSRFTFPALAGLLSLTLVNPALADAPALAEATPLPAVQDAVTTPEGVAGLVAETLAAPALPVAEPVAEAVAISLAPAPAAPAAPAALTGLRIEDIEGALLERVNADRAAYGLAPLASDPELVEVARLRAEAQISLRTLSHYDAAGKIAIQGMLTGVPYSLAGENLARLRAEDIEAAQQAEVALMNSPLHRKNILEPRFNRLAIGLVRAPDGRLIFAQIFRAA